MGTQKKIILSVALAALVATILIGAWSYRKTAEDVFLHTYEFMSDVLLVTIDDEFTYRSELLESSRMDSVRFFTEAYQQEALASVATSGERRLGHFVIIDASGTVLLGGENSADAVLSDYTTSGQLGPEHSDDRVSYGNLRDKGTPFLFATSHFLPWDWQVFYVIPDEYAGSQIGDIFRQTLIAISLVLLLTVTVVILVLKRFIFKRVDILKSAAEEISRNKQIGTIDIQEQDDFGALARSMEVMAEELQRNEQRQRKLLNDAENLNDQLRTANTELSRLQNDMDRQVKERTAALEKVQGDLYANLQEITSELESAKEKNNRLVRNLSELTMKQSEMVNSHSEIVRNLRMKHEHNILNRKEYENVER